MKLIDLLEADETEDAPLADGDTDDLYQGYTDVAEVSDRVLPYLQEKIDKLNKRAEKLRVPSVAISILDTFMKDAQDDHGSAIKRQERYHRIRVTGDTPKLAGWEFVATIEHKDGGNVIRTVPSYTDDEGVREFFNANPHHCDWCNKKRRRVDTFIVKNTTSGEMKQVGSNCLRDFLGGADPKAILWYFSFRDDIQGLINQASNRADERGARQELTTDVDSALNAAAAAVRVYGYRKSSGEAGYYGSTPHMVRLGIWGAPSGVRRDDSEHEWARVAGNPTADDVATANTVKIWFSTIPEEQINSNNFLHSLSVILRSTAISARDVGYVCAVYPAYARAMAAAQEQTPGRLPRSNEHLGEVGQKITSMQVEVVQTRWISGAYGNTQIVTMADQAGNTLEWFNNSANELEQGKRYNITGTVKAHGQYNGRNKTVLTRVKAQEITA